MFCESQDSSVNARRAMTSASFDVGVTSRVPFASCFAFLLCVGGSFFMSAAIYVAFASVMHVAGEEG